MTSGSEPTLVVLHGHDSTSKHGDELARDLDPSGRWRHVAPEGPVETPSGNRAWFSVNQPGSLRSAGQQLSAVVDSFSREGSHPLVVVGYSQGAAAALCGLMGPLSPVVDGLAVISGFLAEEDGVTYDVARLVRTPVLVQHGIDDEVVPEFFATDLASMLRGSGVEVTLQRLAAGHSITPEGLAAARLWLDGHLDGSPQD